VADGSLLAAGRLGASGGVRTLISGSFGTGVHVSMLISALLLAVSSLAAFAVFRPRPAAGRPAAGLRHVAANRADGTDR
jgi:hypothetical protein